MQRSAGPWAAPRRLESGCSAWSGSGGRSCVCAGPVEASGGQARQQDDWRGRSASPASFTLSDRLPGAAARRVRRVNGSWPAAPLFPVPREPWSQAASFFFFTSGRATGDGQGARRQIRAWRAWVPRKMVFTAVCSKGSWLTLGASLESSTDV